MSISSILALMCFKVLWEYLTKILKFSFFFNTTHKYEILSSLIRTVSQKFSAYAAKHDFSYNILWPSEMSFFFAFLTVV